MARILITSGPTRQYLDPVRYLTNASSGRMGCAIARAAIELGHDVTIVTGPTDIEYPAEAQVVPVVTTEQMRDACVRLFPDHDGAIGVAAPCDYRPASVATEKLKKTGDGLALRLVETPDIMAALGQTRRDDQWLVAFALETEDSHQRALEKLHRKGCDLIVLNGPGAIDAARTSVEIIAPSGEVLQAIDGDKETVARHLMAVINERLASR